jgi:hypothetical protein
MKVSHRATERQSRRGGKTREAAEVWRGSGRKAQKDRRGEKCRGGGQFGLAGGRGERREWRRRKDKVADAAVLFFRLKTNLKEYRLFDFDNIFLA